MCWKCLTGYLLFARSFQPIGWQHVPSGMHDLKKMYESYKYSSSRIGKNSDSCLGLMQCSYRSTRNHTAVSFFNYCVRKNEVSAFLLTCDSKNPLFSLQTHELTHSKCRGWKCECVVYAPHDISLTWQLAANKYGCKQCTFRQLKRIISVLFLTRGINSTQCILMGVNNCVQEGPGGILIVQLQARGE